MANSRDGFRGNKMSRVMYSVKKPRVLKKQKSTCFNSIYIKIGKIHIYKNTFSGLLYRMINKLVKRSIFLQILCYIYFTRINKRMRSHQRHTGVN